eukprot:PhM_4_TR10953/c0_g1_i1/m.12936/K14998/SURF1, SHY1; surfeit locus 1 family protein
MRVKTAVILFAPTSIITFNCGLWQLYRRGWKTRLVEAQENARRPPLFTLTEGPEDSPIVNDTTTLTAAVDADDDNAAVGGYHKPLHLMPLFHPVELRGKFDLQAAMLVGPRGMPGKQEKTNVGSKWWGESRGGFHLMIPFLCDDGPIVMANAGWVPIDAFKGGLYLEKYLRRNTGMTQTLKGLVKYEESTSSWYNPNPSAHKKPQYRSWMLYRPVEMAMEYITTLRREHAGQPEVAKKVADVTSFPFPRFYVEMVDEDDTARVVIDNEIFPKRPSGVNLPQFFASPTTHLMYACFWFTVCGLSTAALMRTMRHASRLARMNAKAAADQEARKLEVEAVEAEAARAEAARAAGAARAAAMGAAEAAKFAASTAAAAASRASSEKPSSSASDESSKSK